MTDLKSGKAREVLGLLAFLVLATAQVSNMIVARGVAGSVPPFAIAYFRWSIVAIGLSPLIIAALRQAGAESALRGSGILSGPKETRIRGRSGALSVWFWRSDSSGQDESALLR